MVKKTFPGEQEEMPVNPPRPEIEKPADPGKPDTPQEDPQREPAEIPPSAPPSPVTPPQPVTPSPQGPGWSHFDQLYFSENRFLF
jgi:hypothetical protein